MEFVLVEPAVFLDLGLPCDVCMSVSMLSEQAKLAEHTGDSSILDSCKKSTGSAQSKKKKNKKKKARQARKKQQVMFQLPFCFSLGWFFCLFFLIGFFFFKCWEKQWTTECI